MKNFSEEEQKIIASWYRGDRDDFSRLPVSKSKFYLGEHELQMEEIKLGVILSRVIAPQHPHAILEHILTTVREVEELWWARNPK
jgi:hypothetical protein